MPSDHERDMQRFREQAASGDKIAELLVRRIGEAQAQFDKAVDEHCFNLMNHGNASGVALLTGEPDAQ